MRISAQTGLVVVALAGLLSLQPIAQGAQKTKEKPAKTAVDARFGRIGERLKETAKELNLTDAQKQKLKPIFKAEMQKLRAVRADKNLTRQEKLAKAAAVRQDLMAKFKEVLTPKQIKKWQKKHGARLK